MEGSRGESEGEENPKRKEGKPGLRGRGVIFGEKYPEIQVRRRQGIQ